MKYLIALALVFCAFSAYGLPRPDLNDAAHGAKETINEWVGGKCEKEDDCYFFQECELLQCKVEIWAWVVLIAGVTAIVVGIVSCIVCCCCNACSRK